ncbi:MFS transporter [Lacrimispora sp.]|uniref:MFS transporter n=1 Tax=Lacrimispora sp. TaxID=2719234 RepID=UPI0034616F2A
MDQMTNNKGIHRAKIWQIGGFALNNTATNMWLFFMNFIAYYMTGFVGVGVVVASTFITAMRIWDGVTDPFIGFLVDRTDGRFGKNRPFMLIGNLILAAASFIMLHVTHKLPTAGRFLFFMIFYMIYIIGYTFQCVVTKSAQSCLTNDPRQRPLFMVFDGTYNAILFAAMPILFSGVLVPKYGGFTAEFFHETWLIVAPISFLFTCISIFCIAPKDRKEYFGTGEPVKIKFRDYWDVLKHNRAIQMLVVSASTDKLALITQSNATVGVLIYAIICGNYALNGIVAGYATIPTFLFLLFGAGYIATRLGQRKAMLFGTIGGLVSCILSVMLFYMGDPAALSFPGMEGFQGWTFFTAAFMVLWFCMKGFTGISGNIVIPMTADCADYEVYRSGRYVPGLMGTLFSSVDKMISSLAATIVGLMCAAIGFTEQLPEINTPFSPELKFVGIFCMYGLLIIGLICNLVAMKFYPLTKEKMEEIRIEIARIKEESAIE